VLHVPSVSAVVLRNEVQAIKKLCGPRTHKNIVQILKHGYFQNPLFYYIDMELCDYSLYDCIDPKAPLHPSQSIPHFIEGRSATVLQIWEIMAQIAHGVEYIHDQGHIHRDITPKNGPSLTNLVDV